jgi:sialate O-acetylesterase
MMKKYLLRIGPFLTLLFTLSAGHLQAGDFALNRLFSDHMVLQRNQPIRIFGTGTDRSEVVVRLAGQEARSAVRDGIWEVQLPAMTAGGPHTIEVVGPQKLTLSDVMIGDVWVGSGQSNMGMALKSMPEYARAPQSFGNPRVRVFKAKVTPAETPQREIQRVKTTTMDGWSAATPTNSGEISAVGYYFCHAVQRELGVPIGFIHSAQGATSVEASRPNPSARMTSHCRKRSQRGRKPFGNLSTTTRALRHRPKRRILVDEPTLPRTHGSRPL